MNYFNLYPSTLITIGVKKACLFDVEKAIYFHIPYSMGIFFRENYIFNIEDLLSKFQLEEVSIIEEYIDFMIKNKLGMISLQPLSFTYISSFENINSPFTYESLIIDAKDEECLDSILTYFPLKRSSKYMQLRLYFQPSIGYLEKTVKYLFSHCHISNLEIIFNYRTYSSLKEYQHFLNSYSFIISRLIIMGSPNNLSINESRIILNKKKLDSELQCGIIDKKLFMPNIASYINSRKGNSCLYKKISINTFGEISNCPSMKYSYGNIRNTNLETVITQDTYQSISGLRKEKIKVCKDCEFRDICTDCRAFIKDKENIYSQPEKCEYNPYIGKWEDEEGFCPVEKSLNDINL
ncbi:MAG: grasp-with-spasm system SPASM domain peptide maturase [Dysgonamonadaceae bacterium]